MHQSNEIERRAQDKFEAAVFRAVRMPWLRQFELEHASDVAECERQARAAFQKGKAKQ